MKVISKLSFILFLLFTVSSFAQSVKKKARYETSVNRGLPYLEKGIELMDERPTKAVGYFQMALEAAIPNKNYEVEGEAFYLLGTINKRQKQYDIAIDYYEKAMSAFKKGNLQEGEYKVTRELAETSFLALDYKGSLRYYKSFLKLANDQKDLEGQISAHHFMASIYRETGDFSKALNQLEVAEGLNSNSARLNENKAIINFKRGQILEAQSQDDLALDAYKLSENLSKSVNSNSVALESNVRQGEILKKKGKKKEAVEKRKEGLEYLEEITIEDNEVTEEPNFDLEKEKSRANVDIANSYIELDSSEKAITYLKNAIEGSKKTSSILERKDAYGLLTEAYRITNKEDSALISYKNYVGLVDSIYLMKEAEIRASLELNKKLSQQLQRISSLETDRELQEKTIELLEVQRKTEEQNNKQLKIIVYSLIAGLLLLLVLLYFMNKSAKQKKLANQLLALKSLRTQMNPHFIFNALNSVNNFISQNDERSANRYLSDFSSLMRLVLENSEYDFIPLSKELDILKLYVSLEHARFSEKFDYTFIVDDSVSIEEYEIPPMLVQPYIENSVWHGVRYLEDKGILNVFFTENEGSLLIKIEDNGIGREQSKKLKTKNQKTNRSTAMKNIEQRLEIINELYTSSVSVSISNQSSDGSGTVVEITVPKKNA